MKDIITNVLLVELTVLYDRGAFREGKMKLLIEIMIVVWLIDKGINIAEFMIQVLFIYMLILAIAKIIGG